MRKLMFFFCLSLFVLFACTAKPPRLTLYDRLLEEGLSGESLKGKVYVEGDFSKLLNLPSTGAYGEFYLGEAFFLLKLSPPFGEEAYLYWDADQRLRLILPSKSKVYFFKDEKLKIRDLPTYFLGLKEDLKDFRLQSLNVSYLFERSKLEGKILSPVFSVSWRIKEIERVKQLPKPIDTTGFKEKKIMLPF